MLNNSMEMSQMREDRGPYEKGELHLGIESEQCSELESHLAKHTANSYLSGSQIVR